MCRSSFGNDGRLQPYWSGFNSHLLLQEYKEVAMEYDYEKEIKDYEDELYCGYDEYFDGDSYLPR